MNLKGLKIVDSGQTQAMKLKIARNSLWVCYSLMNPSVLNHMVPHHLEIADISPVEGTEPCKMLLFNAYELTSLPWINGARVDIQTFARDRITGTPHLVILEVLTDTRSWDPINGLTGPNSKASFDHRSGTNVNFVTLDGTNEFSMSGCPTGMRTPNHTFIVEANRKCFFGNFRRGYNMDFVEEEIMHPVTDLTNVKIENTLWSDVRGDFVTAFKHNTPMEFNVNVNPFMLEMNKLW